MPWNIRQLALCLVALLSSSLWTSAQGLRYGDTVPDFHLIDQNGTPVSLSQFRGRGVVISFLYTRCPYPDKCPMIGRKLASLSSLMDKLGENGSVQMLAITLDPDHDSPAALKAYSGRLDKTRKDWKFLTGRRDQIASITGSFGVVSWEQKGILEHNLRTVFLDPLGRLQVMKTGSDWRAGEFAAAIKPFLSTP